ncbi:MAG: metallophosphoesterase [Myxococcales bacterium]|nr:metallophosphoesterase [Myxococcales bacterium]
MTQRPSIVHLSSQDPSTFRLAITSDLHYDSKGYLTSPATLQKFVDALSDTQPDLVILAGDLAHGEDEFKLCLEMFSSLPCPIAVLAGNHDIWCDRHKGHHSEDLWQRWLPQWTKDFGYHWLEESILLAGTWGIVGSLAWYDYSAMDPQCYASPNEIANLKRQFNNDAVWIDWDRKDVDFARQLREGLYQRAAWVEEQATLEHLAIATHVPLFEEQMQRKPDDPNWGFSNAYFGHLTAGQQLESIAKLRLVVSGHTHERKHLPHERPDAPPISCHVIPSDYDEPHALIFSCKETFSEIEREEV